MWSILVQCKSIIIFNFFAHYWIKCPIPVTKSHDHFFSFCTVGSFTRNWMALSTSILIHHVPRFHDGYATNDLQRSASSSQTPHTPPNFHFPSLTNKFQTSVFYPIYWPKSDTLTSTSLLDLFYSLPFLSSNNVQVFPWDFTFSLQLSHLVLGFFNFTSHIHFSKVLILLAVCITDASSLHFGFPLPTPGLGLEDLSFTDSALYTTLGFSPHTHSWSHTSILVSSGSTISTF